LCGSCDQCRIQFVFIESPYYERTWRSVNHKMAPRPRLITNAALKVTFLKIIHKFEYKSCLDWAKRVLYYYCWFEKCSFRQMKTVNISFQKKIFVILSIIFSSKILH